MPQGVETATSQWTVPVNRTTFGVLSLGAFIVTALGLTTGTDWQLQFLAIAITSVAILALKSLAPRLGLIDHPQGHKTHDGDVPVIGGLAIYIGLAFTLPLTALPGSTIFALLASCGLLVALGALDDRYHLPVWARFGAQVGAALIMIEWGGVMLTDLGQLVGDETFTLGRWSILVTVVATIGVINSMNMADGLDGLAGTLALATFGMAAIWAASGHPEIACIALLACSALTAFLAFNAPLPSRDPRARVFMGDAGSMMLGLLIAWVLITLSQGPDRAFPAVTALWLFALPLLDTLSVMLRRMLRGRSPFAPDREHLHHILIVAGYSNRAVVGIMFVGAMLFAAFGLLMFKTGIPDYWQFTTALGVFALINLALHRAWRVQRILHKFSQRG